MTFLELYRERIFLLVFVFSFSFILIAALLGSLSIDEQMRMLVHFGFGLVELSGLMISLWLGSSVLFKEIEKQTCLMVLARPISRSQFLLGKFFGILILQLSFMIALASLLFVLLIQVSNDWSTLRFFQISFSIFLQSGLLLAFAMALSVHLRPSLSFVSAFVFYLACQWRSEALFFAKKTENDLLLLFSEALKWCLPYLDRINLKSIYFISSASEPLHFPLWSSFNVVLWSSIYLLLAITFWKRRDFV